MPSLYNQKMTTYQKTTIVNVALVILVILIFGIIFLVPKGIGNIRIDNITSISSFGDFFFDSEETGEDLFAYDDGIIGGSGGGISDYLMITDWETNILDYLLISNWNSTNSSYALFDDLVNGTFTDTNTWDDSWLSNYSAFNSSWSPDGFEADTDTWVNNFSSYYTITNIEGIINNGSYFDTNTWDTSWLSNYSAFNSSWSPDGYEANTDTFVANYSATAFKNEANVFTAGQNLTGQNVTAIDCIIFDSGGKICSGV